MNDKKEEKEEKETTVDPYTGEVVPVPEDADEFIEVIPTSTDDRDGKNYLLDEETSMDNFAADEHAEQVSDLSASYTEDEDIEDDFEERQQLAVGGRKVLEEELEEHHAESPQLSGGDLDAAWQYANESGEETVGGTVATPDQDIVDELGQAVGLTYDDDEPLGIDEKLEERDRNRWELDPESASEDEPENPDEE